MGCAGPMHHVTAPEESPGAGQCPTEDTAPSPNMGPFRVGHPDRTSRNNPFPQDSGRRMAGGSADVGGAAR